MDLLKLSSIAQRDPKLKMRCVVFLEKLPKRYQHLCSNASRRSSTKKKKIEGRRRLYQLDEDSSGDEQGDNVPPKVNESPNSLGKPVFTAEKIFREKGWQWRKVTENYRDVDTNERKSKETIIFKEIEVITLSDTEYENEHYVQVAKEEETESLSNENNLPSPVPEPDQTDKNYSLENNPSPLLGSSSSSPINNENVDESEKKLSKLLESDRFKSKERKTLLTEPKVLHQHQKGKRLTTGGEGRPQQRQIGPKKNKTKTSKLREKACNPYMQSYSKCHNEALQRNASSQKLSAEAISPRQHVKKISKPDNLTQIKTSTPGPVKAKITKTSRNDLLAEDIRGKNPSLSESSKRKSTLSSLSSEESLKKKIKLTSNSTKCASTSTINITSEKTGSKMESTKNTSNNQRLVKESQRCQGLSEKKAETSNSTLKASGNRSDNTVTEEELSFFGLQSTTAQVSSFLQKAAALVSVPGSIQRSKRSNNEVPSLVANVKERVNSDIKPGILKYAGTCVGGTGGKTVKFALEKNQVRIIEPRIEPRRIEKTGTYKLPNRMCRRPRGLG